VTQGLFLGMCATWTVPADLKACLTCKYGSFFEPFEKDFYKPDVEFLNPLTKLVGA